MCSVRPLTLVVLLLAAPAAFSAAADTPIVVAFDEHGLHVSGIAPGSTAIAFGVSRVSRGYDAVIQRHDLLATDDDGDGSVTFALDAPVAFDSLWVAVDLATGAFGFAAPSGVVRPMPAREQLDALSADLATPARLTIRANVAELLLVRPAVGVWRARAFEGGRKDADGGRNGVLAVDVSALSPIGPSRGGPAQLVPGDVVVAIDSRRMEVGFVRAGAVEGVQ